MSNPLVSIVTPVFNVSDYIEASMQSIKFQTFQDFEHIILNDGSTDNTADIVEKNIYEKCSLFSFKDNKKIPIRRNEMIFNLSRGKYIAIHDGDDISLPSRLEKQIQYLEDHSDVFCVGAHALKIDEQDEYVYKGEEKEIMDYPPPDNEAILNFVTRKCMNPIIDPTTVFRRDTFIKIGGYSLEKAIYTVPDFDFWLRAMLSGEKFVNILDPLIKYRVNSKGMTKKRKREMINAHMVVWARFMSKYNSTILSSSKERFREIEIMNLKRINLIQESCDEYQKRTLMD